MQTIRGDVAQSLRCFGIPAEATLELALKCASVLGWPAPETDPEREDAIRAYWRRFCNKRPPTAKDLAQESISRVLHRKPRARHVRGFVR